MNMFWQQMIQMLVRVLASLLAGVTPAIAVKLKDLLTGLYVEALKTDNPMDDFVLGLLLDILAIPRPPPE